MKTIITAAILAATITGGTVAATPAIGIHSSCTARDSITPVSAAVTISSAPVFQVDHPDPTADKPQCKLWYAGNCWWALLPRSNGPSLWQRTAQGWKEHPEVYHSLKGWPGKADVYPDKDGVTAVAVSPDTLVVLRLNPTKNGTWQAKLYAQLKPPPGGHMETATIARDEKGEWWVAADGVTDIYTWHSADGKSWSDPILLKKGVYKDDISLVATVPGGVIVVWSNQEDYSVACRLHRDGQPATNWEPEVTIQAGNRTADDHLHSALTPDGTLWMVSKNSVDRNGYPQFVLRVRHPGTNRAGSSWSNFPYAPRTAEADPSRPVIVATPQPGLLLAGHTIYDNIDAHQGRIVFGRIDTTMNSILAGEQVVIQPRPDLQAQVNNCTVPRQAFPAQAPWIILASDRAGRVYEADLSALAR